MHECVQGPAILTAPPSHVRLKGDKGTYTLAQEYTLVHILP